MSCPFSAPQALPRDGTPLHPSPTFAAWRAAGPATDLLYQDGHVGLVVTGYDAARALLSDPRFSQRPHRLPAAQDLPHDETVGAATPGEKGADHDTDDASSIEQTLDAEARASIDAANLLALDGEQHRRMRRGITSRFSVKQVRRRREWLRGAVADILNTMTAGQERAGRAELFSQYAQPIAAAAHCEVIGVPEQLVPRFQELFTTAASLQERFDFIREVIARRAGRPGPDVITDLLESDFTRGEAEGLVFQLMSAGHDSVAYLITTATLGVLRHPEQARRLREDPAAVAPAVEEFLRTGAMFLTLFPRTATEEVDIDGVLVAAGRTVSVSPVGANRDPARWERAEEFDLSRDAFGHLGFGHGPHGCIGQQLARAEIAEGVGQLLTRLETLRVLDAEQERPLPFAHPIATYEAGALHVAWGPEP
ncbi:cytochrome P450 [Brachybacterium sp. YJGR34]|uniref:cytochrome P450 n=1 Tax=Brachybacterium sp. YJGR34 TaxID=2059911 RepID=UPI000E0CA7BC|nr:cytochrome P450 [Brachybacterium sp. YJGR34]